MFNPSLESAPYYTGVILSEAVARRIVTCVRRESAEGEVEGFLSGKRPGLPDLLTTDNWPLTTPGYKLTHQPGEQPCPAALPLANPRKSDVTTRLRPLASPPGRSKRRPRGRRLSRKPQGVTIPSPPTAYLKSSRASTSAIPTSNALSTTAVPGNFSSPPFSPPSAPT